VRINLSEQTDMMDLLGADLPVEGAGPGHFAWCALDMAGILSKSPIACLTHDYAPRQSSQSTRAWSVDEPAYLVNPPGRRFKPLLPLQWSASTSAGVMDRFCVRFGAAAGCC